MDDAPNYTEVSRSQLDGRRSEYTRALLSEIRLIVRTIANDPLKRLSDLKVNYRFANEKAIREVTAPEIIEMISHVEAIADKQVGIDHIGFLQLVRDALVSMTTPATGLTISYTALVAGDQRSEATESRFALAKQAYDMLLDRAIWHRRLAWILTIIAILFTLFAAWEATKAALGKICFRIWICSEISRQSSQRNGLSWRLAWTNPRTRPRSATSSIAASFRGPSSHSAIDIRLDLHRFPRESNQAKSWTWLPFVWKPLQRSVNSAAATSSWQAIYRSRTLT